MKPRTKTCGPIPGLILTHTHLMASAVLSLWEDPSASQGFVIKSTLLAVPFGVHMFHG